MSVKVKMCGITNSGDALDAITAGANLLGFIFVPSSERAVDEATAQEILPQVRGKAQTVGVFRNSSLDEVKRLNAALNFDFVQLHGAESAEYCDEVAAKVIKVLEISPEITSSDLRQKLKDYSNCHAILFDKPKGLALDEWLELAIDRVEELGDIGDYFFAGGLNHTNVGRVLARIQPTFLDVASGIESSPGVKDMTKMIAFCDAVRDSANVANEAVS